MEHVQREMSWSARNEPGLRALPRNGVRFTFLEAPKFHAVVVMPGVAEDLQANSKSRVLVGFEFTCQDHHRLKLIRINSIHGHAVQTNQDTMWLESDRLLSETEAGPFPGACQGGLW